MSATVISSGISNASISTRSPAASRVEWVTRRRASLSNRGSCMGAEGIRTFCDGEAHEWPAIEDRRLFPHLHLPSSRYVAGPLVGDCRMNVVVEPLPNCVATLKVELEPERVEKAKAQLVQEFGAHARI